MNFFLESSIEDSYIYKTFNASNSLIEKIVKYIRSGVILDKEYYQDQYNNIDRIAFSPLHKKVIKAIDDKNIEIMYSTQIKIGQSVPFIIRKTTDGRIVATIFIAAFTGKDKNDSLTIPVKQLYAICESAYIALEMQKYPGKIQHSTDLMKLVMSIYNQMMIRILNKDYSLVLDKVLLDKTMYCFNRFFLDKIWNYPNKTLIHSYASNNLDNINQMDLELISTSYDSAEIKDIDTLLQFVSKLTPRMESLNTRYFIERFVNTFHGSSILAIDYLPYMFYVIANILIGSFLISQIALNDIIKNTKGIQKFYSELSKLI